MRPGEGERANVSLTAYCSAIALWDGCNTFCPFIHTFDSINTSHTSCHYRYIVFDGDVDAVWVENMNSVMDDNRLLTLPNGERIRLQNHSKMLFEVFDLQYASPATISR